MTSPNDEKSAVHHDATTPATVLGRVPAPALVVLAIVSIQLGAVIATGVFDTLGPDGAVAWRVLLAAIILMLITRQPLRELWATTRNHWPALLPYGLCICAMNLCFYLAIARIPLGAAVAFEFIGPLGVAVATSRRASHFAWIAVAAVGIALLSPLTGADLDPVGVLFALGAGAGWGAFILLSKRVAAQIDGNRGLVIGMMIAGLATLPIAVSVIDQFVISPTLFILMIGVALLSTAIPFFFEFIALKELSARVYGVLVSLEPAVAVLAGAALLGERLGTQGLIAVGLIVIAAIGITISDRGKTTTS